MTTFLLTFNTNEWQWDPTDYAAAVNSTTLGQPVRGRWSVGNRKTGLVPGDRGFLVRQRAERGIVASAVFTSDVYEAAHFNDPGRVARYADLDWQVVVQTDDGLPVEHLKREVPNIKWDRLQASGTAANSADAAALDRMWRRHIGRARTFQSPEELPAKTYAEGNAVRVTVNRYERDPAARASCIQHWGTACAVCGFDFGLAYGPMGAGFIHVHHLRELASVGRKHRVDPRADLRPVCPNCHAMLHRGTPALTIKQLRRRLGAARELE